MNIQIHDKATDHNAAASTFVFTLFIKQTRTLITIRTSRGHVPLCINIKSKVGLFVFEFGYQRCKLLRAAISRLQP